jgi:predicted exporter
MAVSRLAGAVEGMPRLLLRLEGAALAAASLYAFYRIGGNWWLFACLVLVPDVSLLAYLGGTRTGAILYNAFHVLFVPILLGAAGFLLPSFDLISIALIWVTHIGIDRALGLGLKYGAGFGFTHLGRIGGALTGS